MRLGILSVYANDMAKVKEPTNLYAQSAVLMDAMNGRVLFSKNGLEKRPMASTTKIMTCILALEQGNINRLVSVSEYASLQPKVRLGVKEGEQYVLKDLLYSLMLESHNDSAVVIAEAVAGDVEQFAVLMNQKANEIGCKDTYFITPNGLDGEDESGEHHTTAEDLAKIMKYCIHDSTKKKEFLEITGTMEHRFSDGTGERHFLCRNHNQLLRMMPDAISGKTGYTAKAGYCYVGALENDRRQYVVALLGCGWPNHKNYKWADARKLFNYGKKYYQLQNVACEIACECVQVRNGVPLHGEKNGLAHVQIRPKISKERCVQLIRCDESVTWEQKIKQKVDAPIEKGVLVGEIVVYIDGEECMYIPVVTAERIEKKTLLWEIRHFLYEIHKMLKKVK